MAGWPYNSSEWSKVRADVLANRPQCQRCPDRSRHVDHIRPISQGGDPWARTNLQALCERCHNRKTYREQGVIPVNLRTDRPKRLPKARRGCTVDGMPKDPNHWWRQ